MDQKPPVPIEIINSGFIRWLKMPADTTIDEVQEVAMDFGRLLAIAFGSKDSFIHIVRRKSRAFLYAHPPKNKSDIQPDIYRMLRRLGFQFPAVPSVDMMTPAAWDMTNQEDPLAFCRFLSATLARDIDDPLFSAIENGLSEYGGKIIEGLEAVSNNMTLEAPWRAWKEETGEEENDPETLFNLYLKRFLDQKTTQRKADLAKRLDPNTEWIDLFQAALILRYEQVLRHRSLMWLLQRSEKHPQILPEKKERLAAALS